MSTQSNAIRTTTSIRSATGLSREALAAWYRQAGLFGPESALSAADQVVVQSQLGPIAGVRARAPLTPVEGQQQTLADYTRRLIATGGIETADAVAQLREHGYSLEAIWEVARLVRNVRELFGLSPRAADVQLIRLATPLLQRAA